MDSSNKCEVRYSSKKWASIAHVDSRTLARYLQTFCKLTLIVQQDCDKFVTIRIPKLLKLRDNYTKDLEVTSQPTSKQEVEVEVEVEVDKHIRAKQSRFAPPTHEEIKNYCQGRDKSIDAERFIDFYSSKGWMVGKNKMKDWKAAVRNWEKNNNSNLRLVGKMVMGGDSIPTGRFRADDI